MGLRLEGSLDRRAHSVLMRIANEIGRTLAAITDTNTFFVRNDLAGLFSKYEISLDRIRIDKYANHIITGYDGRYVLTQEPPYGISRPSSARLFGSVHHLKRQRWWRRFWR